MTGRILLTALLIIAALCMWAYHRQLDVTHLVQWIEGTGAAGALLFILGFAMTTVLFVPGMLFTLAGGVLFGPFMGTLLNLVGATLGASLSFLIARYISSDWISKRSHGIAKRLIDGVEHEGWRFVAFVRLVPIFPFFMLNYALGVTRIRLTAYVITTFITLIPSVAAITYLGYAGREAVAGGEDLANKFLISVALVAGFVFLPLFIRRFRLSAFDK